MGPRPVHRPLCWERLRGILLRPGRGYAPFNDECGNFLGDPDGFRAEDHLLVPLQNAIQTFLCGGSKLPFGGGVFQSRHSVRLPLSLLVLQGWYCWSLCTSCCVSLPVVRPEVLGIMAGMDQEAWFAGFDVVPRAVLLLVSQAPDARHHGRLGPQDSVEVHRCSLGQGFLYARCCATCVLVQTVFYTVAFPQLQFITVFVVAFTLCSSFFVGRPMLPSVYTAWTIAGGAVLGQVVLARRCTTPGAVYVFVLFHLLQETHDVASSALLAMDVLGLFLLVCFSFFLVLCY